MKVIYLEDGPLMNYRKIVEDTTTTIAFAEAPQTTYAKTDRYLAGEEVFVVQA